MTDELDLDQGRDTPDAAPPTAPEERPPLELTEVALEGLLFVAERPLTRREIASLAGVDRDTVDQRLGDLEVSLAERGIRLVIDGDRVELATAPDAGALVARYVGADAIRSALLAEGLAGVPSVRTINRILGRRGALDGKRRTRRPAPPRGWYLPDLAASKAELDGVDIVEGLALKGGPQVEVLNLVSLHGGLVASWPVAMPVTTDVTLQALVEHWREVGLPRVGIGVVGEPGRAPERPEGSRRLLRLA